MAFLSDIVSFFNTLASYFYDLYLEAFNSVYIPTAFANILYTCVQIFNDLAWAFSRFGNWVYTAQDAIDAMLDWPAIVTYIQNWLPNIEYMDRWFDGWWLAVQSTINVWWSDMDWQVQQWIDTAIAEAEALGQWVIDAFTILQAEWDQFKLNIPTLDQVVTWFGNWAANVWSEVATWWNDTLPSVDTLINDIIATWFPWYDDLVQVKDELLAFFADPLEWLYIKMDAFFERFW